MNKFQIILMGVFGLFLIGGVIIFSAYRGNSQDATTVVIWGTMSANDFNNVVKETSLYQSKEFTVQYVQKTADEFDSSFVESLASGVGPDIFMLPSQKILKHRN